MPMKSGFVRAGWFIGMWVGGVVAVGLVGLVIKLMLA
jgi:hypothetical protein